MKTHKTLIWLILGLVPLSLSSASATSDDRPKLAALAEARYQSARALFDDGWLLYGRKGLTDAHVYQLSFRLLTAQLDRSDKKPDRIDAYQQHLDRMAKMRAIVNKLRGFGYANTFELKELDYLIREAEYWLEREKTQ